MVCNTLRGESSLLLVPLLTKHCLKPKPWTYDLRLLSKICTDVIPRGSQLGLKLTRADTSGVGPVVCGSCPLLSRWEICRFRVSFLPALVISLLWSSVPCSFVCPFCLLAVFSPILQLHRWLRQRRLLSWKRTAIHRVAIENSPAAHRTCSHVSSCE